MRRSRQHTDLTDCCTVLLQVTLAFINTKRPKECGSCGSLLDAVCLTKA